jgi:hypothetical protein
MNHQNNRPLAKLETVPNPPSCGAQKATASAINPNIDQESELKLVVAYDDFNRGNRARYFFDGLAERFSNILTFIQRFLKFEQLAKPRAGERQPGEAAAVDIIVIVADEHADLHDLAEEWMRTWKMTSRVEGRRLLALFSTRHQENVPWDQSQSRFHQVARRTGMRFGPQTTPTSKTVCRVAGTNPRALQPSNGCRRTQRNLCDTSRSLSDTLRCAATGDTPVDPQITAVSHAIIEVMRSRQRKTFPATIPLANAGGSLSTDANQIRVSSNL